MYYQIVARKSVAPSSGDFWQRPSPQYTSEQDQKFEEKSFIKLIILPLPRTQPDVRKCVTSMNLSIATLFFAWRAWQGDP